MERRQLEYFLAVVERGSLSAAAAKERVSQPSISHSINMLERDLGVALFHRTGRGMRPTPHGEALIDPAMQTLRGFRAAKVAVGCLDTEVSGHVDVVCPDALAIGPVSNIIGTFLEHFPDVTFRIRKPRRGSSVRQSLAAGFGEVAFVYGKSPDSQLVERFLFISKFCALRPPGSSSADISVAKLLHDPLVLPSAGTYWRAVLDELVGPHRLAQCQIVVESEHPGAVVPLVIAGLGSTIVPEHLITPDLTEQAMPVTLSHARPQAMYVVRRKASSEGARAFVDFAVDGYMQQSHAAQ